MANTPTGGTRESVLLILGQAKGALFFQDADGNLVGTIGTAHGRDLNVAAIVRDNAEDLQPASEQFELLRLLYSGLDASETRRSGKAMDAGLNSLSAHVLAHAWLEIGGPQRIPFAKVVLHDPDPFFQLWNGIRGKLSHFSRACLRMPI